MNIGAGISYTEKVFDPVTNFKNVAASTHLNALISLRMEGSVRIATPLYLSAGLGYTHASNGSFKRPNAGLNYVTVFAGASYKLQVSGSKLLNNSELEIQMNIDSKPKTWSYTFYLSGGVKSYSTIDDSKFAALGLSFEASRKHLEFTRFNGTLDIFYDTSDYDSLVKEQEIEVSKIQTVKSGVTAGYDFLFGRLSAILQAGCYLYAKNQQYGMAYQRIALSYLATDRIKLRIGLKMHLGRADYIELVTGYRIR